MSDFKREERYIVVKLKHLVGLQVAPLRNFLRENRVPALSCVVVESDWPEFEPVWQLIERRMTGQPAVSAAEELDAVLHWRTKHAQAIKERDALQRKLTAATAMHPFAEKVIRKLERFQECADDGQGADIGRHWFDLLTQLGLLNRVQRSPALWEMTQQGEDALELSRENARTR